MFRYFLLNVILVTGLCISNNVLAEDKTRTDLPKGVHMLATFSASWPVSVASNTGKHLWIAEGTAHKTSERQQEITKTSVSKWDNKGNKIWKTMCGPDDENFVAKDIIVDQKGNSYVVADAGGAFALKSGNGAICNVAKLDKDGRKSWTAQFGPASNAADKLRDDVCTAAHIALDSEGNVYATGFGSLGSRTTSDRMFFIVVQKIMQDGTIAWRTQIETGHLFYIVGGIASDKQNNVYVAGSFSASYESGYFLLKLDKNGTKLWEKIPLSPKNRDTLIAEDIAINSIGDIYITGYTASSLDGYVNKGGFDVYLIKFSSNGDKEWSRSIGTPRNELIHTMTIDKNQNVLLVGRSDGDLVNKDSKGMYSRNYFIARYDKNGNSLSLIQFGNSDDNIPRDSVCDTEGNLYVVGEYGAKRILMKIERKLLE